MVQNSEPIDPLNPCRDCSIVWGTEHCKNCIGGNSQAETSYWSSLIGSEFRRPIGSSLELMIYRVLKLETIENDGDDLYWVKSGNSEPELEFASEIKRYQELYKKDKYLL